MRSRSLSCVAALFSALLMSATPAQAVVIAFQAGNFGLSPTFNNVATFSFAIDVADVLVPGGVYVNPVLNGVVYNVFGTLPSGSPSGFQAFNLQRTIGGAAFYLQGSSLRFEISPTADLSNGLQASELLPFAAGTGGTPNVFEFNGREVGTGRYHPALFELKADGTGLMRNSNNSGGINPGSGQVVNVQIGDEYVTALTFTPTNLTLAAAVPEPATWLLLLGGIGAVVARRQALLTKRSASGMCGGSARCST